MNLSYSRRNGYLLFHGLGKSFCPGILILSWLLTHFPHSFGGRASIRNYLLLSLNRVQVLLVVEGSNDVEFLRRISRTLHFANPSLLDISAMEAEGRVVFIPFGGGHVPAWSHRLEPLKVPEFHLLCCA